MLPFIPTFVDSLFAAWNAHDVAGVLNHYTADYEELDVARAVPVRGHAEVRRLMAYYLRAFPICPSRLTIVLSMASVWRFTGRGMARSVALS